MHPPEPAGLTMDAREAYDAAMAKRAELQDEAREMGISEEYISRLVDLFYARVRKDPEIGPIFNGVIGDHWPEHLAKLKGFWRSLTLRTGEYEGRPMPKHVALTQATPRHFEVWLGLFEKTLRDTAPNERVVETFMGLARQMAARFQRVMFG